MGFSRHVFGVLLRELDEEEANDDGGGISISMACCEPDGLLRNDSSMGASSKRFRLTCVGGMLNGACGYDPIAVALPTSSSSLGGESSCSISSASASSGYRPRSE